MTIRLAGLAIFLAMGACAWRGPDAIVTPTGPNSFGGAGTVGEFAAAYDLALRDYRADRTKTSRAAFTMVQVGSQLQYQLCKDFFRGAGKEQQWLLFGKDTLATIGGIATGVIGATGGPAAAVAWVGLSTAAGVAGINLYERNFLFSENNVKAVEDLTLKAVGAARDAAIASDRADAYDFPSAVSALMDVQGVCEVQNILDMVRKSIGIAQPYATTDTDTGSAALVRVQLGNRFIGNTALSPTELQALYWAVTSPPTSDADRRMLATQLRALNPSPYNADGTPNERFTPEIQRQVRIALGGLPPKIIEQLESGIKPSAPPAPGAVAPGTGFSHGGFATAPRTLGRIRIDIR